MWGSAAAGSSTYQRAADAVAALDFSAENAEIVAIRAEQTRLESARNDANAQLRDLDRRMQSAGEFDGSAIADALLAGRQTDAGGVTALQDEARALTAGVRVLDQRIRSAAEKIEGIQRQCAFAAFEALTPLAAELTAEAREAGEAILRAHAGLKAVLAMTGRTPPGFHATKDALAPLILGGGLAPQRTAQIAVPDEVAAVLALLLEKGEAVAAWRVPSAVTI